MDQEISNKKKNYKIVLVILGVILLAASIVVLLLEDFGTYRFLRGLISFAFLAIILWYRGKLINPLLALFLLCYGASSFATIAYENQTMATIALLLNFVSILFLIKALWPKVSLKNIGTKLAIVFVVLIIAIGYLFYNFIAMLKDFAFSDLHYAAMLLGAMGLLVCCFLSLVYNHSCNSKASLVFTIVIFLIAFAEVFRAIGYYDFGFGDLPVYIARFVLIVATALLAHFSIMQKTKLEQLSRKIL